MNQQSKTILKKAIIGILCSVILILLDQFTKHLAVKHLKDQMPVVLWKNVFELSYLENRGAAFGILQGKQWPLIIFTVIVLMIIIYLYDAYSIRKAFRITQCNRHSVFWRCDR